MTKQGDILHALLAVDNTVEKDVHMKRFGVDFRIRAITGQTINQARVQATRIVGKGKKEVNEEKFGIILIQKAVVNVDFGAKELLEKFGVEDATEVIPRLLLAGEIATLTQEILTLSGFEDESDSVDELKN